MTNKFYKPWQPGGKRGEIKILPLPNASRINFGSIPQIHWNIKRGAQQNLIGCTHDDYCPICQMLTAMTRAKEFVEAQLDWTW